MSDKNHRIIVTGGLEFTDIDAYGSMVAYAELLKLQGIDAIAVSTARLNDSVSVSVRGWGQPLNGYRPDKNDKFIVVDVSNPEYFDAIVDVDRIVEVIDHHTGFEKYWMNKLGDDKTDIEFIGAACTQIYERWADAGLVDEMSEVSAKLLLTGILDNTLNFKANITTKRDVAAYRALLQLTNLGHDWPVRYFAECEHSISQDPAGAVVNDSKYVEFSFSQSKVYMGQLLVWDAAKFLGAHGQVIEQTMTKESSDWMVNIIGLSDGISYFLGNDTTLDSLSGIVELKLQEGYAVAPRLWLRKEVIKKDQGR